MSARPAWATEPGFDAERKREFETSVIEGRPLWIVLGPPAARGDSLSDGVPISRSITPAVAAEVRSHHRLAAHCEDCYLFRRMPTDTASATTAVETTGPGPSCTSLAGE